MVDNENSSLDSLEKSDILGLLTDSAFEFLEKAVDEFESSTKFSAVHFAISVELFLKARLVHENWELILTVPGNTSEDDFRNGNFRSITGRQSIEKLNTIQGVSISEQQQQEFERIFNHRNKVIHFVHHQIETEESNQIAAEQIEGWRALLFLISRWEEFDSYYGRLWGITSKMADQPAYRK